MPKKLIEEQVIYIRERAARGESHKAIADRYGVNRSVVSAIATGRTHRYIGGPRSYRQAKDRKGSERKFRRGQVPSQNSSLSAYTNKQGRDCIKKLQEIMEPIYGYRISGTVIIGMALEAYLEDAPRLKKLALKAQGEKLAVERDALKKTVDEGSKRLQELNQQLTAIMRDIQSEE